MSLMRGPKPPPATTSVTTPIPKMPVGRPATGYTPPQQERLPPLPNLIKNQPLPVANTPQYEQTQAMYAAALAQLQASQQAQMAMQAQLNRMSAVDPTAALRRQMMAQFQGDPFAAQRAAMNQLNQVPQRFSTSWMGVGY
jgi:hypothetical protein